MTKRSENCPNTAFFLAQFESTNIEEARAVVIGMYAQNELQSAVQNQLREHFTLCRSCRQILEDLSRLDKFLDEREALSFAVCPSSENLDTYRFQPDSLGPAIRERIEKHLLECPMCTEEIQWLDQFEEPQAIPVYARQRSWLTYLPAAAAAVFLLLSLALFWQNKQSMVPDHELRSLAVIKEPEQINFEALEESASALAGPEGEAYRKGVSLFKQHRFQEAADSLQNVLERNPDHSATLVLLGYSHYKMGNLQSAYALCDQAEKTQPHSLERCMLLVNIALKTGHFNRAITELTSLYHTAPDQPEIKRLYDQVQRVTKGRLLRL